MKHPKLKDTVSLPAQKLTMDTSVKMTVKPHLWTTYVPSQFLTGLLLYTAAYCALRFIFPNQNFDGFMTIFVVTFIAMFPICFLSQRFITKRNENRSKKQRQVDAVVIADLLGKYGMTLIGSVAQFAENMEGDFSDKSGVIYRFKSVESNLQNKARLTFELADETALNRIAKHEDDREAARVANLWQTRTGRVFGLNLDEDSFLEGVKAGILYGKEK